MPEIGGNGSEVSESTEVNETPPAETGGESSEATQEAATEEANESGGFDDPDNTEAPDDNDNDYEEMESDEESDDSLDVGFDDGDDVDNTDAQSETTEPDDEDDIPTSDEDRVGFDDSDTDDGLEDDTEDSSNIDTSDEEADAAEDSTDESENKALDDFSEDNNDVQEDDPASDLDEQPDEDEDEDTGELEDYTEPDTPESDSNSSDVDDNPDGDFDGNPEADDNIDDNQDIDDDGDAQSEAPETDPDSTDVDDDLDDSPVEDSDGDLDNDGDIDDAQDADDGADAQSEAPETDPDSTDVGGDLDDSPVEDSDGDLDNDGNIDDAQDADDDAETQDEEPEADPEGNDVENLDDSHDEDPDGDLGNDDGIDDDSDDDLNAADDFDNEAEDEDPGEIEQYSEDEPEENEDETDSDDEAERDEDNEKRAVEEEDEEAEEQAEKEAIEEDADNIIQDEANPVEDENRKITEEQPETESEDVERDNDGDASTLEPSPEETAETEETQQDMDEPDPVDDESDELDDAEGYRDEGEAENYEENENPTANAEPVTQESTTDEASAEKDAVADEVSKSTESLEDDDAYRSAINNMSEYMNEHNYSPDDYAEYSKDPEWQKLNADLQRSMGMEVTPETPDTATPSESGKDVSASELPDNCVIVNASDIDMTYAQGMDSDQFWNHHGNTKEDYMRVAEKIPDVQQALDSGKSLDEIKQDPELRDTVRAYYDPDNMIKVEQQPDGSYSFNDDGRHRIAAAQEYGYQIPVEVTNMPENANALNDGNADIKPGSESQPETQSPEQPQPDEIEKKAEISDVTRESLEAFDQSNWDKLSHVEKEQAVEKLRDSIAEDLQLENKPNIAYYDNENPGDYGGYAASTNTIYINRFNMGDAAETADTIAHESRHCWQHERADNPQTEQDYLFKENFDAYIRPEDDFYEYRNQPVEADARDYAREIKETISEGKNGPESDPKPVEPEGKIGNNDDAPPSETGPPESSNEKIALSDLPEDFDRKVEVTIEEKISEVNHNISEINDDPSLDDREKLEKISKVLNEIGFDVDVETVAAFADQKIEVVQMDGTQKLYRRGYDTEGDEEHEYGKWWSEDLMSIEETRDKMAVLKDWGNPLTGEYQAKPPENTLALKGIAAPQDALDKETNVVIEHRDGGGTQYYIASPDKDWCKKTNQR